LAETTPLRKSPCTSEEHQNETQSSGDASLVATTSLQHLRSNASGEASLVTEEHQNETQSSGDASLVTEEHQNETQSSKGA
jgi:hypothetical protein